eukprot:1127-Heterococcus_DN1.PRE.1
MKQQPKFKRKVGVIMFTRFLLMPAAAATMLLLGSRAGLIPVSLVHHDNSEHMKCSNCTVGTVAAQILITELLNALAFGHVKLESTESSRNFQLR